MKITFIGMGVMGSPMAAHLANAGHDVTVFNRTKSKAKEWAEQNEGQAADTIKEAVRQAECVITCVGADRDLRAIYLGEMGIIANTPEGAVLIDHTTASGEVAVELADHAASAGKTFLDAPVSGGQQGAEKGQLTIMCGGKPEAFSKTEPVMRCYGKAVTLMGDVGAGQLTKMANQISVAGVLQGLAESLHFAEQVGLDRRRVIDVISQGAAQSWQMENRSGTMIDGEYNHGFAVDWMRKDLGICLEEARNHQATLPLTALIDQFYADVQNMGGGRWDTSSLLERLRESTGRR